MNASSDLLHAWSQARASLAAALSAYALAITGARDRTFSGFRWRGEYVVTAAELLGGSESVTVLSNEGERQASVVARDLTTDVAVLKVPVGASTVPLATASSPLQIGAGVAFAGRSVRGPLVAFGTVRLTGPAWSSRRGGGIDQRLEFGGDLDARFEGAMVADFAAVPQAMLVAGPRGTLLGIPASTIERIVTAVEQHGHLPRPYLGVRLQSLWLDEATRQRWGRTAHAIAAVSGVEAGSAAERAGVFAGDLLEAIDDVELQGVETVAARLAHTTPGQQLQLRLRRGGQPETVTVQVSQWRPS